MTGLGSLRSVSVLYRARHDWPRSARQPNRKPPADMELPIASSETMCETWQAVCNAQAAVFLCLLELPGPSPGCPSRARGRSALWVWVLSLGGSPGRTSGGASSGQTQQQSAYWLDIFVPRRECGPNVSNG